MPHRSFQKYSLILFINLFLAQSFLSPVFSDAEETINREPIIKAGLLLKFTNFIQWPEVYSSLYGEEPLNICLHGKEEFGDIFDYVNDHDILRRKILVKRNIQNRDLNTCHILYFSSIENENFNNLANEIKNSSVLVVTESEKLSHSLVAINFRKVNNRIRFEINRSAFERSGIIISSELLNLAINVVRID